MKTQKTSTVDKALIKHKTQELDLAAVKHATEIRKLGQVVIHKVVEAGTATLELCRYIRKNQIAPKVVSRELAEIGFHRVRISEINAIAMASDENWREFDARTIGIKKVLELERGNVVDVISEVSGQSRHNIERECKAAVKAQHTEASGERHEARARSLEKAMALVLRLAEYENIRKKTAHANGWTVTVSKIKVFKPKVKEPSKDLEHSLQKAGEQAAAPAPLILETQGTE